MCEDAKHTSCFLGRDERVAYFIWSAGAISWRSPLKLPSVSSPSPSKVSILDESSVTDEVVSRFQVVIAADQPESEMLRLNASARVHGARFVAAEARGLFCRVFSDFGPSFRVDDINGENPVTAAIADISTASPGVVTVQEERRHEMEDGDMVTFSEVRGMTALNDRAPMSIKVTGPFSFTIGDTSGMFGRLLTRLRCLRCRGGPEGGKCPYEIFCMRTTFSMISFFVLFLTRLLALSLILHASVPRRSASPSHSAHRLGRSSEDAARLDIQAAGGLPRERRRTAWANV